jgi:hypothetical protein
MRKIFYSFLSVHDQFVLLYMQVREHQLIANLLDVSSESNELAGGTTWTTTTSNLKFVSRASQEIIQKFQTTRNQNSEDKKPEFIFKRPREATHRNLMTIF